MPTQQRPDNLPNRDTGDSPNTTAREATDAELLTGHEAGEPLGLGTGGASRREAFWTWNRGASQTQQKGNLCITPGEPPDTNNQQKQQPTG